MKEYFLKFWDDKGNTEILQFFFPILCWKFVLDRGIRHFCVYEAECVIDNSPVATNLNMKGEGG